MYHHLTIILDDSSSMRISKDKMLIALKELLEEEKTRDIQTTVSLYSTLR